MVRSKIVGIRHCVRNATLALLGTLLIATSVSADVFREAAIRFYESRESSMLTEYQDTYQQLLHSSTKYAPDNAELQQATRWLAATIVRSKFYIHAICFEEGLRKGIGSTDTSALATHIEACASTKMNELRDLQRIIVDVVDTANPELSETMNRCLLKFRLIKDEVDFPMPKDILEMIPPTVSLGGLSTDTAENELYDYPKAVTCIQD